MGSIGNVPKTGGPPPIDNTNPENPMGQELPAGPQTRAGFGSGQLQAKKKEER